MDWQPPRTARTLQDPITGFQILGERSSGTNFVAQLLAQNLVGVEETAPYGWKHGFIDRRVAETPGLLTVVVYRHPLRWLPSLHRRPLELSRSMQGLSLSAFLRTEWRGAFHKDGEEELSTADLEPKTGRVFSNPLRLRNAKVAYLEELASLPARVAYVRFEDANRDPRGMLRALSRAFDLTLGPYSPVAGFKGNAATSYVPRALPRVTGADLAFLRAELDLAQEARLGYRLDAVPRFDGLAWWDPRSVRGMLRR